MTSNPPIHSTGRGGAGNIGPDNNTYVDAGIVREGYQGESLDGAYSTGRGGAGNVGKSPSLGPQADFGRRGSSDIVPETALRSHQENFHTGRGGGGNVHREKYGGHSNPPRAATPDSKDGGLKDKVKSLFHKEKPAEGSKE
ncbi:hypothetical protein GQ43DRAFT_364256 [Delitschia confertaspora ATCC 74209]|uniref:Uncharacterized protein n=1 Tax=Delitschia confertaspora ATCC 74209 TaxID=1513339 RepID=A0A9P4JWR2_9PLEO|nr:hypothetical protein GQ43DRAFT_364256 [Delitschia confertaspora ATCC 74209]